MEPVKLVSWNVNGLRAVAGKGFAQIFDELDADCVCLQETKLQKGQIDLEFLGYTSYWNYADKPGYSGTVIYTRKPVLSVSYGLGIDEHDHEGRVVTVEFEDFYLVNVYVPNSQDGLRRLDYRMNWEDAFRGFVKSLESKKPVVVCGDMNVAHRRIDIKNAKPNIGSAGFSYEERGKFSELLAAGFVDSFRELYPDAKDAYSWWSYMGKAREKNVGWRIDYFLITEELKKNLADSKILSDVMGSDHCPVELILNFSEENA